MTIIAFDVAKAELVGVAMNKSGNVKERFIVTNTPEAIVSGTPNLGHNSSSH